ncbi:hypothetical protein H9L39_11387 [Fusarium oxysporum f. sp. albedinis]|nr:hypothetical protein H9L39_11387 [Fusarium oxysporum f. sp. albedinis]
MLEISLDTVVLTSPRATSDEWKLVAQLVASGWVTRGGVCEEPAEFIRVRPSLTVELIEMNSKHTSGLKRKASDKLETVSMDEFLRRLGPGGRRDWVNSTRGTIDLYEAYESKNPAETTRDNTQLGGKKPWQKEFNYSFANSDSGNSKAEGTSNTKSSQDMDNIRKIGRLMERVEALEAENRALKKKNSELEDKQAKVVKLLTDD